MPDYTTRHIAAGEYIVGSEKPVIAEAYLSSCVGVILYDPIRKIGGLSHFLLPEPVSIHESTEHWKYASTGLVRFIDELQKSGATTENLRAVIAGGAFSGRLSQLDINLDIGGRTTEMVKKILLQEGIQIESSETGGFFSCRMSLNMLTWKAVVAPCSASDNFENKLPELVSLSDIEKKLDNVQPIPQVALKILRMINADKGHLDDFSNEVKKDQVISANVLKFCNSVVFGGRGSIDTINDALLIIGQNNLAKIVTNTAVNNLFSGSKKGYSLVQGELYHHAIGVALLSEKIAGKTKRVAPFTAYAAGLLHDIGKVVLDQFVALAAPLFYREFHENYTVSMIEVENKFLNTNHTIIGQKLAEKWSLPETISTVIGQHHLLENRSDLPEMVYHVALANLLLHMFKAGPELTGVDMSKFNFLLERLGFSLTDFPDIVDLIPVHILTATPEIALGFSQK